MSSWSTRTAALLLGTAMAAASWGPALADSPFAGRWRGAWTDAISGQSGDAAITVDADGVVGGTIRNASFTYEGPVNGRVTEIGEVTLRYTYDQGQTVYRAAGLFRTDGRTLTGEVDFVTPDGERIGHGLFRLGRAGGPDGTAPSGKTRQPVPDKADAEPEA